MQLDDKWLVGVCEISLNSYKPNQPTHGNLTDVSTRSMRKLKRCVCGEYVPQPTKRIRKRRKNKINLDDVEVFALDSKFHLSNDTQLRARDVKQGFVEKEPALIIHNNLDQKGCTITVTRKEFLQHKFVYNTKHNLMNLGTLLEKLTDHIKLPANTAANDARLYLSYFKKMLKEKLNGVNWSAEPYEKIDSKKDDLNVRVYLGSPTPAATIVLRLNEYQNIGDFIHELLIQVPPEKRKLEALTRMFNTFYLQKNIVDESKNFPFESDDDDVEGGDTLTIHFDEIGAAVSIPFSEIYPRIYEKSFVLKMDDFLELFKKHLQFNTQDLDESEKQNIRDELYKNISEMLRTIFIDDSKTDYTPRVAYGNKNQFYLELPVANNETKNVVVTAKEYRNFNHIVKEVYKQVPAIERSPEALINFINRSKKDIAPSTLSELPSTDPSQSTTETAVDKSGTDDRRENREQAPQEKSTLSGPSQSATETSANKSGTGPMVGGIWPIVVTDDRHGKRKQAPQEKDVPENAEISNANHEKSTFIYIYTDIIKPRPIAGQNVRCLRVLPVHNNKAQSMQFMNVEYHPVEKSFLENLSILIVDGLGQKINFNSSSNPTMITLHFKKKSMSDRNKTLYL